MNVLGQCMTVQHTQTVSTQRDLTNVCVGGTTPGMARIVKVMTV